ncbi:MAG: dihydropteroate synthase [Chloroflexaceae bacterium]|nr:dihydropteroate synthase [Chloroflexaceae bacterium]
MPDPLILRNHRFAWGDRTYIQGILNVTPDSFSDGGEFATVTAALAQGKRLVAAGADILDVGGQSTRPGAETISLEAELNRVIPAIAALRAELDLPISVDTTRAVVAEAAIAAGADLINDISGATYDPNLLTTAARLQVPVILMHLRGTPATMSSLTDYGDLIGEISRFLGERLAAALAAGLDKSQVILDPGLGFAKNYQQNLELLRRVREFRALGTAILVGPSRKRFIGQILQQDDPKQRVWGTAAACCAAIAGGADLLRVHDVAEMVQVARVADAIWRGDLPPTDKSPSDR